MDAVSTDDLYLLTCVMRMSRKHMEQSGCGRLTTGMLNRRCFVVLVSSNSKHTETSFSQISTYSLCLQHAQMPGYRDLAIFVPTTTTTETDYSTPFACARDNYCMTVIQSARANTIEVSLAQGFYIMVDHSRGQS